MITLPAQPNQSLIDGIAVLQELSRRGRPISGLELARDLHLEKTRVNRLLKTLAFLGLTKTAAGRKYVCGDGIHILAAQSLYASGLLPVAMPLLTGLQRYGYIVALGVLWRDKTSYLYHHNPTHQELIAGLGGMGSFPVGESSIGMVLLAQKSEEEVRELYGVNGIEGFAGTRRQLQTRLARIRRDGYADIYTDHHSLAVPLGTPPFAALALSGSIPDDRISEFVTILQQTATQIEEGLHAYHRT